jgi:multiple sugar transport system permease protein
MKNRRTLTALTMLAPMLAGLTIFFVVPLILAAYWSFTRYNELSSPTWAGLLNYRYLFTRDPMIGQAVRNTLWFVVIMVPARIVCAMLVAGLLARTRASRLSGVWRTLFYLPALVPPVASVVAFVFLFNPGIGPANQILGHLGIHGPLWFNSPHLAKPSLVVMSIWGMGDIMIIFLASMLDVPAQLYEAAALDGANTWQQTRHVTLPTIAPVIGFAAVTGAIAAFQLFTENSVASAVASGQATVGGGSSMTLGYPDGSLMTYTQLLYQHGFANFQFGYASAMAIVLFAVTATLLAFTIRRIPVFRAEEVR